MSTAMTSAPKVSIYEDKQEASRKLADDVSELIREINDTGRPAVLGLATGSTPITFYKALIGLHQSGKLSFKQVITFNLDEYLGLPREHAESYWTFMHQQLFDHVDLPAENIHLPQGIVDDVPAHCAAYEQAILDADGLDFQLLGIGRTGHIGFNEPGSPRDSRTREIQLDPITREDAAPAFGGLDHVPTSAITMGCGTILSARRIALLAFGSHKASIVKEALEGPVTDQVSASFLQEHPDARFYLDKAAAAEL